MAVVVLIIGLAVVWLLAGAGKLAVPQMSAAFLSQLTRVTVTATIVRVVAAIEVAISIGLVTPTTRQFSAFASSVASLVLAATLLRARTAVHNQMPCGCFGPLAANRRVDAWQFALVAAMFLASLLVLMFQGPQRYLGLPAQMTAVAVVMLLVCTRYLRLRQAAIYGSSRR